MAQPSIVHYFNTRKRPAVGLKTERACKILKLDNISFDNCNVSDINVQKKVQNGWNLRLNKSDNKNGSMNLLEGKGQQKPRRVNHHSECEETKQGTSERQCIQTFLNQMKVSEKCVSPNTSDARIKIATNEIIDVKNKLLQNSRLSEVKQRIQNIKKCEKRLEVAEKKTQEILLSPKLKSFRSIEIEISTSPQKSHSPEKPYLSPKKNQSFRRNLLAALSPEKCVSASINESCYNEVGSGTETKGRLKLPFKYRLLAEIFRAIDIVAQILFNRKETITFQKLKPAVEEILKKTLTEKHLGQIKYLYPNAYSYHQEKLKHFTASRGQEKWHLVLSPNINNAENMTSEILLNRRRKLYEILIDRVKTYHDEFLLSLVPPVIVKKDQLTRWHPEFDLEKVPDIEEEHLPEIPFEEKFTTGKEVLEKARQMFNCNTRMEQALAKLQNKEINLLPVKQDMPTHAKSLLKGIPEALLEKVRQKQASKALMSMTLSRDKDKTIQMYKRLPEIARFTRNLFVSEKKSVLQMDILVEKLNNSYRGFLNKIEIEEHLKTISTELPNWLKSYNIRNSIYLKLDKNADLNSVISRLEKLAKEITI